MMEKFEGSDLVRNQKKWKADNVSKERREVLRNLGLGDTEDELQTSLGNFEQIIDMLPRGTMRFREMPNAKYREVAIRVQDDRERSTVIELLENIGLLPWYTDDGGVNEIVVSHPGDLEILDNLGLTDAYSVEQFSPKERKGEPEVLRALREKAEQTPKPPVPLHPSLYETFPAPRSPEQPVMNLKSLESKKDRKTVTSISETRKEQERNSEVPEIDIELSETIERFELGLDEEDRALIIQASQSAPTLTLFPRKYQWDKKTRALQRIRTGSIVTPGQQHRLLTHAKNDARAMRECLDMNIGLVLWCMPAMMKKAPRVDPDDLFQSGLVGLVRALRKYGNRSEEKPDVSASRRRSRGRGSLPDLDEVSKGWTTYLIQNIESEMRRHLHNEHDEIRRPVHTSKRRGAYNKSRRALEHSHPERDVSRHELGETMHRIGAIEEPSDLSLDRFERTYWINAFFSYTGPDKIDEEAYRHVVNMTAQPLATPPAEEALENAQRREVIKEILSTLTPREELVLRMRFGLADTSGYDRDMTLEEIGNRLNISKPRVQQIEAKAFRRLRHPSRSKQLFDVFK